MHGRRISVTAAHAALSDQKELNRSLRYAFFSREEALNALALATPAALLCVRDAGHKIEIVTSELTLGDLSDFRVIVPLESYLAKPPKSYAKGEIERFAEEIARAMNEALVTIGKGAIIPLLRFRPRV